MIPKRPKLSNFTLYFKSNCPHKSTPNFGLKMNNKWSNVKLKGQMMMNFTILRSTERCWNKESNETKIKRFGLKIREKFLFQNQGKSAPNLGKNEEQIDFKTEIDYLNLI